MGLSSVLEAGNNQVFEVDTYTGSNFSNDDGRLRRTGTVWTASAHIITAVIGSGVLSLAWAMAQLGWVAGPSVLLLFAFVTYYTSALLISVSYRNGDSVTGEQNRTYVDAVRSNLGASKAKLLGLIQCLNLLGVAVGYTLQSSISMMAIKKSNCYHTSGRKDPCKINSNPYMIGFGVAEILLSQIPNFDQLWWLSSVTAVMSFTYCTIGLGLGIAKIAETGKIRGSVTGISVRTVTESQKIWGSFQALGNIAFTYSFTTILIEIQDTLRSPQSDAKTMRKATLLSVVVATLFYTSYGFFGYAAFGDSTPANILTGFGFYNPFWLIDIANAAIVIHLAGAYQVFCQPLYAFIEKKAADKFPECDFITKDNLVLPLPFSKSYKLNPFRIVWRTVFVVITTIISMLLPVPFYYNLDGLFGSLVFWPLNVYFPVEMYISKKNIVKWSKRWISLNLLSMACLIVTIAGAVGSIAGIISDLHTYKPFNKSD